MTSAVAEHNVIDNKRYNAGEVILFPGEPKHLYRVRSGLVRIHTVDDEGNGLTLRYVKPEGFFGEEVLRNILRRYFAEAVTKCELEVLNSEDLSPEAFRRLNMHLIEVIEHLYRSLYRLSGKRLRSRIAAELLDLQDSAIASISSSGQATVHMTHDDLAAAVGSVRETVTKVIGELVRMGAIDAGYGKIKLIDVDVLHTIADE